MHTFNGLSLLLATLPFLQLISAVCDATLGHPSYADCTNALGQIPTGSDFQTFGPPNTPDTTNTQGVWIYSAGDCTITVNADGRVTAPWNYIRNYAENLIEFCVHGLSIGGESTYVAGANMHFFVWARNSPPPAVPNPPPAPGLQCRDGACVRLSHCGTGCSCHSLGTLNNPLHFGKCGSGFSRKRDRFDMGCMCNETVVDRECCWGGKAVDGIVFR